MPTWLGIDIGEGSVKVAAVRTAYRMMTLAGLGSADVATTGSLSSAVQSAVLQALGGKPGSGDGVAVALDGQKAAVRTLMLPASAQRQLAEVLLFELEAQVPFDITESVFDFRVLKHAPGAEAGMIPVLAAVARISDVKERIDLVKGAIGAEPERVGVGAFPLANLLPYSPALVEAGAADKSVVVVDLGTTSSDVLILKSGEPVFSRTINFGTEGLPQSASRLAREIRVTLASYRADGGDAPVHVFLCGGGAFVSGAESFLSGELETTVSALPAAAIEAEPLALERVQELPRYARAVGLALGLTGRAMGLDLRKGPLTFERGFAWVREKIPVVAGLGTVILVSFLFSACSQLYATGKEKTALEGALGTVTKEVLGEETTSADRATELLMVQTGSEEDPMMHADAFDVMVKLSEDIPQSMVHDIEELDVQKGHVVVHGIVGTIPDAQSIAATLRNEKCFSDVKVTRTNQMVGTDRQKYVLEFDLKCPEDLKGVDKKKAAAAGASASASASATGGK
jgi:general secretion pathway protein L